MYMFLIERVRIVRGRTRSRAKDKLYIFNMTALIPYCAICVLAIIFRVDSIASDGRCLIGVERQTSILVIAYDLIVNVRPLSNRCLTIDIPYHSFSFASSGIILVSTRAKYSSEECRFAHILYYLLKSS
jgi:hypothetical protein